MVQGANSNVEEISQMCLGQFWPISGALSAVISVNTPTSKTFLSKEAV